MVSMDQMFSARLTGRLALRRKLSSFLRNEVGLRSDEAHKVLSFTVNDYEAERFVGKVDAYWRRKRGEAGLGDLTEGNKARFQVITAIHLRGEQIISPPHK